MATSTQKLQKLQQQIDKLTTDNCALRKKIKELTTARDKAMELNKDLGTETMELIRARDKAIGYSKQLEQKNLAGTLETLKKVQLENVLLDERLNEERRELAATKKDRDELVRQLEEECRLNGLNEQERKALRKQIMYERDRKETAEIRLKELQTCPSCGLAYTGYEAERSGPVSGKERASQMDVSEKLRALDARITWYTDKITKMEPLLARLKTEWQAVEKQINERFDRLDSHVGDLCSDMCKLEGRISSLEGESKNTDQQQK